MRLQLRSAGRMLACGLAVACLAGLAVAAPPADVPYHEPVATWRDLVQSTPAPRYVVGPRRQRVALLAPSGLPLLADLERPRLVLAGVGIDPRLEAAPQTRFISAIVLIDIPDGRRRPVQGLPPAARIDAAEFSPDEQWLALTIRGDEGVTLWLADTATGRAHQLLSRRLNAVLSDGFQWLGGSRRLMVSLASAPTASAPVAASSPSSPRVQETAAGRQADVRTFADFLKGSADDDALDRHLQRQLASVDLAGHVTPLGTPDRFLAVAPSPDGRHFLTSRVVRPYPRTLTLTRFPRVFELRDAGGHIVETLHASPSWEQAPGEARQVEPGPRDWGWRADASATLFWTQAADDPAARSPRDEVFLRVLPAPAPRQPWLSTDARVEAIDWSSDYLALVRASAGREVRLLRVRPGVPGGDAMVLRRWDEQDRFASAGRLFHDVLPNGERVLTLGHGGHVAWVSRTEPAEEGERLALSALDLSDGHLEPAWQSSPPNFERAVALIDDEATRFLVETEAADRPVALVVRSMSGAVRALNDTSPERDSVRDAQVRVLHYRRDDGVELSARLYLPHGYEPVRDGPLPLMIWVYPKEYGSVMTASQRYGSPYRYAPLDALNPLGLLTLGYAVLQDPSIPIVAPAGGKPNDTYPAQLAASMHAAVDEVVRQGVAQRGRIAIGGHSYGASTVANLLADTDLFAAGIAMSGAYNRTLTPFGFQNESRRLWDAPPVYEAMSPFLHAQRISAPLLLVHGASDENPGTQPEQSERMYDALRSLGKPARLVVLPGEGHMYKARESVLDVLWEEQCWLERQLGPPPHATELPADCPTPPAAPVR